MLSERATSLADAACLSKDFKLLQGIKRRFTETGEFLDSSRCREVEVDQVGSLLLVVVAVGWRNTIVPHKLELARQIWLEFVKELQRWDFELDLLEEYVNKDQGDAKFICSSKQLKDANHMHMYTNRAA